MATEIDLQLRVRTEESDEYSLSSSACEINHSIESLRVQD